MDKYCKDCGYFRLPGSTCTGPQIKKTYNLVTGSQTPLSMEQASCQYQRYTGECGKDGQFFQSNS